MRISKLVYFSNENLLDLNPELLQKHINEEIELPLQEQNTNLNAISDALEDVDSLGKTADILNTAEENNDEITDTTLALVNESLFKVREKYQLNTNIYSRESLGRTSKPFRELAREAEEAAEGIFSKIKKSLSFIWDKMKSFVKNIFSFFANAEKKIKNTLSKVQSNNFVVISKLTTDNGELSLDKVKQVLNLDEQQAQKFIDKHQKHIPQDTGIEISKLGTPYFDDYMDVFGDLTQDGFQYIDKLMRALESPDDLKDVFIKHYEKAQADGFKSAFLLGSKNYSDKSFLPENISVAVEKNSELIIGAEIVKIPNKLTGQLPLLSDKEMQQATEVLQWYVQQYIPKFKPILERSEKLSISQLLKVGEENSDLKKQGFVSFGQFIVIISKAFLVCVQNHPRLMSQGITHIEDAVNKSLIKI